jgi:hypothetical protein
VKCSFYLIHYLVFLLDDGCLRHERAGCLYCSLVYINLSTVSQTQLGKGVGDLVALTHCTEIW